MGLPDEPVSPRPAPTERHVPTLTVVWAGALGGTGTVPVGAGGLDDALGRVAPRVVASVPGLGSHTARPRALAELRAGRLARSVPAVRALADLAEREAEGASAQALVATGAPDAWVRRALARREADGAVPTAGGRAVDRLMRLAGPASFRDEVDAEIARAETAVAEDPEVAALERAWRSLGWLARRLDLRGGVRLVAVTDVSLDALLAGPALAEAAGAASLVVVDAALGPSARDVDRAGRLAEVGAAAGVPVVASAAPELVGAGGRHGAVPPVRHTTDAAFAGWLGLRQRPEARALALAFPEVRLGPGRDLWGGGALAVAADAAAAWARGDGLAGLGRQPVPDLAPDDLAVALGADQAADLARAGVATVVPRPGGAVVAGAPSAAAGGTPARDAALSLPAALFASRLARALAGADDPRAALARELDGWGRLDADADADGLRAVLPAAASPTLGADVGVRLDAP